MAIDFPDSPSLNDVFTSGDLSWTWNGTYWEANLTEAVTGPTGPAGLVAQTSAPTETGVLWLDTDEAGTAALSEASLETYLNGNMATNMIPDTNSAYDLGTAEYKWRDLYLSSATIYLGDAKISSDGSKVIMSDLETGDIHLNNESRGGNSVDGTWGSYRIEEGQNDLFLINQRTGKKYKFNLTEVDPDVSA